MLVILQYCPLLFFSRYLFSKETTTVHTTTHIVPPDCIIFIFNSITECLYFLLLVKVYVYESTTDQ